MAKPRAVVLDISMPGENAWKFLVEFKSADATRQIPVVITCVVNEQEKGFALGDEDCIVKSVERTWLIAKLRMLSHLRPVEKILVIDDEEVA